MFQIDPLNGFWTIKHITCGARFEIKGQKILDAKQQIKCPNCGINIDTELLKSGVDKFDTSINELIRATQQYGDPTSYAWQIEPPIKFIEDEETPITN